jgi:hypothetical protein
VGIYTHPVADRAAQQLVDRHAEVLAGDVPERLVEARERAHQHRAAAEEGRAVDMLPVVLDAQRVFADQIVGEFLDGGDGALGLAFQGGLAPADQAGVSGDFHQPGAQAREELLDANDVHARCSLYARTACRIPMSIPFSSSATCETAGTKAPQV